MNLPARSNTPDGDPTPAPRTGNSYAIQRPGSGGLGDYRPPIYQDDGPVFVLANLRVAAGFPFRAFMRHRKLGTLLLGGLLAMVALAIAVTPRHYIIKTRFFAEKNFVMPGLSNPERALPTEADSPTRLAAEAVMKRSNLLEIIRQTKLMDNWDQLRSPLGKVKDAVMEVVRGPLTESDRLEAMLGLVEKRLWVEAEDGTVLIGIDWADPALGFRIVQTAQQNFFEQRHASEISLIGESIGIIEGHVASSQKSIQEALGQINAALSSRAAATVAAPAPVASGPAPLSAAVVTLQSELRTTQQTITDIATSRSQRLAAAQARLAELRGSYGSAHPDVAAAEENIRALEQPSTQLAELKAKEASLLQKLGSNASRVAGAAADPSYSRVALERYTRPVADSQEAPEVSLARSRLKIATNDYEVMMDRLVGAKIELETARAAFKYRYSIITPARIPKEAEKPRVPLLVIGGIILSVLATLFTVVMLDFGSGRVIEPWQVDRQLGLPVLAEVQRR
ncbi:MAG: hypothetical protein IT355_10120 [Gemmatimonadaceae bacterium]|nr:hypothetical protein [Gemmatimonadaceae bacterium]